MTTIEQPTVVQLCPEGYEAAQPLPQPKRRSSRGAAEQCREMGIKVGDTIIGREGDKNGRWFNETKLTLLFLGEQVAVWKVARRNNSLPEWRDDDEAANWTLCCRQWYPVAKQAGRNPARGAEDDLFSERKHEKSALS